MAKVADKIFINSSAKVQHFCELCKKKIRILYTISVNTFSDPFAHNSAVHIPQQSVSFAESSYPDAQESRVVKIYTNIRILRFDTMQKYT